MSIVASAVSADVRPVVAPLQTDVTGGGLLALVVTFLLTTLYYAVTLHLAALWVVGDEPHQRAATVAPLLAVVSLVLQQWGAAVVIVVTFVTDLLAIGHVYDLERRPAFVLTAFHFAFAVIVGFALVNVFGVW